MKKILLVEDNKDISRNIKEYLELEGYDVIQAFDGELWIEKATKDDFDLILLDLMLPEVDGISIARRVVAKKWTPIIMITARESVGDKLLGFETGAVDYLVKPFDLRELHARIMVHIKNNSRDSSVFNNNDEFVVWEIYINLKKHEFTKWGQDIHLTQKEFLIMDKLISLKDQVVSRSDIIEYLWWGDSLFDGDNKLDVYISNIRSKLWKQIIKTVKWVGYMLGE
jgi:DNA-binding response OmpR family regulator